MADFDFLPVADWRNDGWTLNNASTLFAALNNDDDTKYIKSPASKGLAEVTFPIDTSSVPEGAVITSVTVHLRCAKVGSGTHSVTVNVLPSDDEAKFTSRTIHPSTSATTFEVASYVKDALGHLWDVERLNKLRCRVFTHSALTDCIRVYKLFCKIKYRTRPTVSINEPTGVVYTTSPTVSWTYTHSDGDPMEETDYRIFREFQTQHPSFNPEITTPVYKGRVQGYTTSFVLPTALPSDNYVIALRSKSIYGAKSKWAYRTFEVQGPAPAIPGNDNANASGIPGVGTISLVPDDFQSAVFLTMRDASNLLSVQQADAEVRTDTVGYTGTNCTIARDTATVFTPGQGSYKLTASSASDMSMLSTFVEVAPSTPVTIRAQVRAGSTARTATLTANFYDASFTSLGSSISGSLTDASTTWNEITATGTTPANTAYCQLVLSVASPALSEVHYADRLGVMYGTGSAWSSGGHMGRNLLTSHQSTGNDHIDGSAVPTAFAANNSATSYAVATASGTGAQGGKTHRMTYNGITPTIGFRAVGTSFVDTATDNDFTLNKPAGVVDGDLLVAFVTTTTPATINPPTGWSLVNSGTAEGNNALYILKKDGLTADPASWAGTFASTSSRRTAVVVAYSGAASASDQFVAENVKSDPDGAQHHTTATVNNTIANSWRIAAFCARDDVGGGTMTANINPPAPKPPSFVGVGAKWSRQNSGSDYVINRPSGVASGDLMLAFVTSNGSPTINAPSGWTLVRRINQVESGNSVTMAVFKRTAGSSEPSSWSGTLSSSQQPVITTTTAYRSVKDASLQFVAENGSTDDSGTSIATATVNNTNSNSMRVVAFGSNQPNPEWWQSHGSWSSTEASERFDGHEHPNGNGTAMVQLGVYDSNTTVSTGNHSVTGYNDSFYGAVSWIGLIAGADSPPTGAPNETERRDVTNGSSDPWQTLAIYDSNAGVATGPTQLTGSFSATTPTSVVSWIGLIKPASPVVIGEAAVKLNTTIDISKIPSRLFELADRKISVAGSFLGSTSGVPYLTLEFYRANQLISTATAEGSAFGTAVWSKSSATFDLPTDCTRVKLLLSSRERAVADTVSFSRLSVGLGDTPVWRDGTSRAEHPIWSYPEIQYADDDGAGYGDWQDLPGIGLNPPEFDPLTGLVTFTDHTIVPLHHRKYRARTVSYGLAGDVYVSGWGPESEEASLTAENWWLKDISDPDNSLLLDVRSEPTRVKTVGTSATFYPFGTNRAVVVGDGYKGDEFTIRVITRTSEEFAILQRMVRSNKTFLLKSDVDHAWWVRLVGDIEPEIQETGNRKKKPLRFVTLNYVEVAPPEE